MGNFRVSARSRNRLIRESHGAFTLVELLGVLLIVAVLFAFLFPVVNRAMAAANRAGCLSNLRGLHIAINMYATENSNRYPASLDSGSSWPARIASYLPRVPVKRDGSAGGLTFCPATKYSASNFLYKRDRASWRTDYNANPNVMSNNEANNIRGKVSAKLILLLDGGGGTSFAPTYRHSERFNLLFVDGHCETRASFDDYSDYWSNK